MLGLKENQRMQEEAANKELAQGREDAIKTLKYLFDMMGIQGVMMLLREAELDTEVFDYIADSIHDREVYD